MHVAGLQYFPTRSLYQATEYSDARDIIYQQAFTFNSEYSTTVNSGQKVYLTIPLNELVGIDETSNPDKKFNMIIVSGYAAISSMNDATVTKFVHTFVTDWNLYAIDTIISYNSDEQSYFFTGQNDNVTNNWSPSGGASNWVNGSSNVIGGTSWDALNYTPVGWSCKGGSTGSGGTGPSGGVDINGNPPFSPTSDTSNKYLFVECTGFNTGYIMIARTPGVNYTTAMLNVANNLILEFYVHGFSTQYSNMGDLKTYISPNWPTNELGATLLHTCTPPGGGGDLEFNQTSNSSPYQKVEINLNLYRTANIPYYIYFTSNRTTSYRGDMAIDGVSIKETNPDNFNFATSFQQNQSVGAASNTDPVISNGVIVAGTGDYTNASINFLMQNPAGKALYIKGSYLLM